jgi:hypothetical protein
LNAIDNARQAALRRHIDAEPKYRACKSGATTKDAAMACLGQWESAYNEYYKLEMDFWTKIEQREADKAASINELITTTKGQQTRLLARSSQSLDQDAIAAYKESLRVLNEQLAKALKMEGGEAMVLNLKDQIQYLERALDSLDSASAGFAGADKLFAAALDQYEQVALVQQQILLYVRSRQTDKTAQFYATEGRKTGMHAQILREFLRAGEPVTAACHKEILNALGEFETIEACLAVSPSRTRKDCATNVRFSSCPYDSVPACLKLNPKLSESQCASLVKK